MVEIAGNDTIYNEVKSSIIGLLSLTISTDLNDQQQVSVMVVYSKEKGSFIVPISIGVSYNI